MIGQKNRFHGIGSLRFVYSRGKTVRGPLFAVRVVNNNHRNSYRAAVVVSRKIHRSAVKRNRMRRRLYELTRQLAPAIDGPHDIVITVFSDQVLEVKSNLLGQQLKKQLKEAGVLKKHHDLDSTGT